ncbi:hypothetical protein C8Q77DRAFT_396640 [Trametes polyzona]|nr:hypothetical protein C8Q77DRAFT_396640 [Trametes polyzona]
MASSTVIMLSRSFTRPGHRPSCPLLPLLSSPYLVRMPAAARSLSGSLCPLPTTAHRPDAAAQLALPSKNPGQFIAPRAPIWSSSHRSRPALYVNVTVYLALANPREAPLPPPASSRHARPGSVASSQPPRRPRRQRHHGSARPGPADTLTRPCCTLTTGRPTICCQVLPPGASSFSLLTPDLEDVAHGMAVMVLGPKMHSLRCSF